VKTTYSPEQIIELYEKITKITDERDEAYTDIEVLERRLAVYRESDQTLRDEARRLRLKLDEKDKLQKSS